MTKYIERPTVFLRLPISPQSWQTCPTQTILSFGTTTSIDFGSICYIDRSSEARAHRKGRKVLLRSLDEGRVREVKKIIERVLELCSEGTLRPTTIYKYYSEWQRFMDWCDSNNYSDSLTTIEFGRSAFRAYVTHLRRSVDQHQLTNNWAWKQQQSALFVLQQHFGIVDLHQGINLLIYSKELIESTSVPCETKQGKLLAWCKCLFTGLADLVLEEKSFPYALRIPAHMKWDENRLWVFPTKRWTLSPESLDFSRPHRGAFDYKNGGIYSQEQLVPFYSGKTHPIQLAQARYIRRSAENIINDANNSPRHRQRIRLGMIANHAFVKFFIAITGGNASPIFELKWTQETESEIRKPANTHQGFRSVKFRAGHRDVFYDVGSEYMPLLRRFCELRNYLLNGSTCEYLFFTYDAENTPHYPIQMNRSILESFNKALLRVCPSLENVTNRELRAAKQDYLIRHHDPYVVASQAGLSSSTRVPGFARNHL
jgi:hypothetical protein